MKLVQTFTTRPEASMLAAILDEHAIHYLLQSDDLGGLNPALSYMQGINIYVSDDDYERTLNLLEKE